MDKRPKFLRWLARLIGGVSILAFIVISFSGGLEDFMNSYSGHRNSMAFLMGFAILGYVFAWFREREGGLILIISGIIIGLNMFYSGGMKEISLAIAYPLPALVCGALFLIADKHSKQ